MTDDYPRAVVRRSADGQLVLDDPEAVAMLTAVSKHNCTATFEANTDRVQHFTRRVQELGSSPDDVVIVILNVDDSQGAALADVLMPNFDWQAIRDRGEVPFARGLAGREGIQDALELIDKRAAKRLRKTKELATVVVDFGTAEVFYG